MNADTVPVVGVAGTVISFLGLLWRIGCAAIEARDNAKVAREASEAAAELAEINARAIVAEQRAMNAHLARLNGAVADHLAKDDTVQSKIREDVAYLRGRVGEPQEGNDKARGGG